MTNLTIEEMNDLHRAAYAYCWDNELGTEEDAELFATWYVNECDSRTDHDLTGPNQYPQMYWLPLNYSTFEKWVTFDRINNGLS